MSILKDYQSSEWFGYLEHSMQDLVSISFDLLEGEEVRLRQDSGEPRHDYSFVVFPMAKAYEGFLKKFFYEVGLIDRKMFEGRYFRIGKSLNPDLPIKYRRRDWVYERLDKKCTDHGRPDLTEMMWMEWKQSRNLLFHYFPKHKNFIDIDEARVRVESVAGVMEQAVGCGIIEVNSEQ